MPATHRTTNTAIEILDFVRRSNGVVVSDVTAEFDVSRSTAYTHLNTLKQQGLIVFENGEYAIGLRFREFSVAARTRKPSYLIIERKLRELSDDTDHEIEFLVEESGRVNVVYHSENVSHDRIRLYLHNTAAGKAILAELPDDRVHELLDRWGLPAEQANTITDRDALFRDLERVRELGYAYNDRECFEGYHGIGACVEGIDGSILGAVTIGGPVYRLSEETLKNEQLDVLRETIRDIEAEIRSQRETITAELATR